MRRIIIQFLLVWFYFWKIQETMQQQMGITYGAANLAFIEYLLSKYHSKKNSPALLCPRIQRSMKKSPIISLQENL